MDKRRFPDYYPECLKKISWVIEDKWGNNIAGPNAYYNKHLDPSAKGHRYFIKQVLLDFIYDHLNAGYETFEKPCEYLAKNITIWFADEQGEFSIKFKKDKTTKKETFDIKTWRNMWGGMEKKWCDAMLKTMLKHLKETYDRMLKA